MLASEGDGAQFDINYQVFARSHLQAHVSKKPSDGSSSILPIQNPQNLGRKENNWERFSNFVY